MNTFKIGNFVRTLDNKKNRGMVKYIACSGATQAGGRVCDKKACLHPDKEFVWVSWPDRSICSYKYDELEMMPLDQKASEIDNMQNAIVSLYKDKSIKANEPSFDFARYNGFVRDVKDRNGRKYTVEEFEPTIDPIPDNEINWDAYHGLVSGPVRKKV
jgi:hypothetical protein